MRSRLIPAALVVALLSGALWLWRAGLNTGRTPDSGPPAGDGTREGTSLASKPQTGAAVPEAPAAVALSGEVAAPDEAARSAVPPAAAASPTLVGAPVFSPGLEGDKPVTNVTSPELEPDPEGRYFERKYAGVRSDARRAALKSLQAVLDQGAVKDRKLSEDQLVIAKREVEWLLQHGGD